MGEKGACRPQSRSKNSRDRRRLHWMTASATPALQGLVTLQRHVFVGRRVGMPGYQAKSGFPDPGADPVNDAKLPKMRVDCVLVHEQLDLVQRRFALFGVELGRLFLEERVDIWIAAIDVGAALRHECFKTCGGIAEAAARSLDQVLQPLLTVALIEGRPLERPQLGADAHRLQIVDHRLGEIGECAVARIVAGIEAFRIPASASSSFALTGS